MTSIDILAQYGVQDDHIPWAAASAPSTITEALAGMDCDDADAHAIRDAARDDLARSVASAAYGILIDADYTTTSANDYTDTDDIRSWLDGDISDIATINTLAAASQRLAEDWLADDDWHSEWVYPAPLHARLVREGLRLGTD